MKNPELKPGIIFPTREIGTDPEAIREFVTTVEQWGFDFMLFYDHTVLPIEPNGNNMYSAADPFHEPFTLMSYIAACTSRIKLITGVLVLPQRQTALVAKQAAQVDLLSRGRLELGVGIGNNPAEFQAMGADYASRAARMEEQIELLRAYLSHPIVTYCGQHEQAAQVGINPRPEKPIPIWMGGGIGKDMGGTEKGMKKVLDRIVRLGDGWMPMGHPQSAEQAVHLFHELLTAAGEDPSQFPIMGAFGRRLGQDISSDSEIPKTIEHWKQLGASHIAWGTMAKGYTSLDEHLSSIEQVSQVMVARNPLNE